MELAQIAKIVCGHDIRKVLRYVHIDPIRSVQIQRAVRSSRRLQLAIAIHTAMNSLTVPERTSIVLRELEGLSYEEISIIMRCPVGTVRSRIYRAREEIVKQIGPLLDPSRTSRF